MFDEQKFDMSQETLKSHNINQTPLSRLQSEQNLTSALIGGLIASLAGGIAWAFITVATGHHLGWLAIAIGIVVGLTVRKLGKGIDKIFGLIGAVFSLFGCFAGNYFTIIYILSRQESVSIWQLLTTIGIVDIFEIMKETFQAMDALFYGIAIYEGYRLSFRQLTEEQLKQISA